MQKQSKSKIIIEPSLDEKKKDGYYFKEMSCDNCEEPNGMFNGTIDAMISKRHPIPKDKFICPNCGCKTLHF